MKFHSVITATGSYLPENIVTNDDLAKKVDTSDEWIRTRTGICSRHIGQEHETTSMMSTKAAERALEMAGLTGDDIDLIIVGTVSPNHTFPSVACLIQQNIGMKNGGAAFDLQGACSGFLYGLHLADSQIKLGVTKRALVIGAEKFSAYLNWEDRATSVLFGDGAGAVILEAKENTEGTPYGLLGTKVHADGDHADLLISEGGVSTTGTGRIIMNGREVFRHAVRSMVDAVAPLLTENNMTTQDISWLIPHQANLRIIEAVSKQLDMPLEKIIQTVSEHANTSAASIPLALDNANHRGLLKQDDMLLMSAFGSGFTWAGALIRWQEIK